MWYIIIYNISLHFTDRIINVHFIITCNISLSLLFINRIININLQFLDLVYLLNRYYRLH
jgi:hypothetical protein